MVQIHLSPPWKGAGDWCAGPAWKAGTLWGLCVQFTPLPRWSGSTRKSRCLVSIGLQVRFLSPALKCVGGRAAIASGCRPDAFGLRRFESFPAHDGHGGLAPTVVCKATPKGMVFDSPARLYAGVTQLVAYLFRNEECVRSIRTASSGRASRWATAPGSNPGEPERALGVQLSPLPRKRGRVVDGSGLESRSTERCRKFESSRFLRVHEVTVSAEAPNFGIHVRLVVGPPRECAVTGRQARLRA